MKIVPLSKKTLNEAIALTLKCFPESRPDDWDYPEKWLKYSLEMKKNNKGIGVGYSVVVDKNKVVGISGLYYLPHDKKEAFWVAWTCVDPKYRGKKLGSKLLDLMIKRAKKSKKKFLRLYTDTRENERVARLLYKSRGFKEFKREKDKKHGGEIIYMELRL